MFDYTVRDSSILPNTNSLSAVAESDSSIRIGIVRGEIETERGIIYSVDVLINGKHITVGCVNMTKFGGAHNYEEIKLRPWLNSSAGLLSPAALAEYNVKAGDVVVVAFLNGRSKEGIVLGCLSHPARKPKLAGGSIAYMSEFNGLQRSIADDGSYKVSFKGYLPANDKALRLPPTGVDILPPVYNPLTGGSYYGFSDNGSFIVSDAGKLNNQFIKVYKDPSSGSIILNSGSSVLELGGNPATGKLSVKTTAVIIDAKLSGSIKTGKDLNIETKQLSIKSLKVAMGNDAFEIFSGLSQLIDALGTIIVTSPVGVCTPLSAAPTWAAQVIPLKLKIDSVTGSLASAESFSLTGDDDIEIIGADE